MLEARVVLGVDFATTTTTTTTTTTAISFADTQPSAAYTIATAKRCRQCHSHIQPFPAVHG